MKVIRYNLCSKVNRSTDDKPQIEEVIYSVAMEWSEANEAIAQREAYNGEYTIEDDGVDEVIAPTQLDVIEAQVAYTAMMTNTLLEV